MRLLERHLAGLWGEPDSQMAMAPMTSARFLWANACPERGRPELAARVQKSIVEPARIGEILLFVKKAGATVMPVLRDLRGLTNHMCTGAVRYVIRVAQSKASAAIAR